MSLKKILILGASSDIGSKTINLFLEDGWEVFAHFNKNEKKGLTFTNIVCILRYVKKGKNNELKQKK